MDMIDGHCEPVLQESTLGVSAPCHSQEDMVGLTREESPFKGILSCLEKQKFGMILKSWQLQKEQLEKDLYDCTKAHKRTVAYDAYQMSKLQVSFGVIKRQESIAKERLDLKEDFIHLQNHIISKSNSAEDALDIVGSLQTEAERLKRQLQRTESENRRLNTALTTMSSELDRKAAENESLSRALEAARKTINNNVVESVNVQTDSLIAQHELQSRDLQELENNVATGEGLVTDKTVVERLTSENEDLHRTINSVNSELLNMKQKLVNSGKLAADLSNSKQNIEMLTKEKEELLTKLDAATNELQEIQKKMSEIGVTCTELSRYVQVIDGLKVEKITLISQLELLREELEKQREAVGKAQIEERKPMQAEQQCAKAFKLVEEKEEEIEYFARQLEILREKNGMLRMQIDMEHQCKAAEMATMPGLHEQSIGNRSHDLDKAVERQANSGVQESQKIPLGLTTLNTLKASPTPMEIQKASDDDSIQENPSKEQLGRRTKLATDDLPNCEPILVQQSTMLSSKQSLRLRVKTQTNTQQSVDSGSTTSGGSKQMIDLTEEDNDEDGETNEENRQTMKRGSTRKKRPPIPLASGIGKSKKRERKKSSINIRKSIGNETDADLAPAHLLLERSSHGSRAEDHLHAVGIPDLSVPSEPHTRPSYPTITPRRSSRLPR